VLPASFLSSFSLSVWRSRRFTDRRSRCDSWGTLSDLRSFLIALTKKADSATFFPLYCTAQAAPFINSMVRTSSLSNTELFFFFVLASLDKVSVYRNFREAPFAADATEEEPLFLPFSPMAIAPLMSLPGYRNSLPFLSGESLGRGWKPPGRFETEATSSFFRGARCASAYVSLVFSTGAVLPLFGEWSSRSILFSLRCGTPVSPSSVLLGGRGSTPFFLRPGRRSSTMSRIATVPLLTHGARLLFSRVDAIMYGNWPPCIAGPGLRPFLRPSLLVPLPAFLLCANCVFQAGAPHYSTFFFFFLLRREGKMLSF